MEKFKKCDSYMTFFKHASNFQVVDFLPLNLRYTSCHHCSFQLIHLASMGVCIHQ